MFTGIVEELGRIKRLAPRAGVLFMEVSAEKTLLDTKIGDSIAVNGACLTVISVANSALSFEVVPQTLKTTNLGLAKVGQAMNLERSLKLGDRISGHFVSGHIDCLGRLRRKFLRNGAWELEITMPAPFRRYCLPRGSVAINGISLTLARTTANFFTVCVIPHTFKHTNLSSVYPAGQLNVEFDLLAKRAAV